MGLNSALVDKARVVQRESTGVKVEGTTQMAPVHSEWFRARLFLTAADERKEQGERRKTVSTPQLLIGVRDLAGGRISIDPADDDATLFSAEVMVEVVSAELGSASWYVSGMPEPIRKKRRVIGYLANVERVVENPRAGVR